MTKIPLATPPVWRHPEGVDWESLHPREQISHFPPLFGVYLVKNKVTGQLYVGKGTSDNGRYQKGLKHRVGLYLNPSWINQLHAPQLSVSIIKHGIENFTFDILEICETKKEASAQEDFYIKKYTQQFPDLMLNLAPAGKSIPTEKGIYGYLDVQTKIVYDTIQAMAAATEVPVNRLRVALKRVFWLAEKPSTIAYATRDECLDYNQKIWCASGNDAASFPGITMRDVRGICRPVYCVETGERFSSSAEAARSLLPNASAKRIGDVAVNILTAAKRGGMSRGFHWKSDL